MIKKYILLASAIIAMSLFSCKNDKIMPPEATQKEHKITTHNKTRIDNYYWLKNRDDADVIKYLNDENNYLKAKLEHTENLQNDIFDEIISRISPKDKSVPYFDNGYFHFLKYEPQKEHPVYFRQKNEENAKEELLIDVNKMAEGHPFFELEDYSLSPDNKILAYSIDTVGRRKYEIRFRNLETGEIYADTIQNTDGNIVWANDNKTIFYAKKDNETLREYKICKHKLGDDANSDIDVFIEEDDAYDVSVFKSKSDKYIFIASTSTMSSEYQFLDVNTPDAKFKIINPREKNHEYHVAHYKDKFIIVSNYKAKNFRIFETAIKNPQRKYWKEIQAHSKDIFIEEIEIFDNYLLVKERVSGLLKVKIKNFKENSEYYLDFGEDVFEVWFSNNYDFNSHVLRYGYSSLTTPVSYYDYNLETKEKSLLKERFVGKDFNRENYESKQLFATAEDGTKIPISLVYKKGITLDGNNPMLVYAYGSYGYSMDTYFQTSLLSLLNRGFVYAIAHIRGGQELGREWYDNGKLLKKKNTFTDFIACTDFLQKQGYSKPEKTFAEGGSAGGLLMGAVANMKPNLYKGIVAEVPFVDVVTTMLDKSIPLTTSEYDEWGNPENKEYFDYMLSYSPYDQVKKQAYPAMLVTAGLHDSQVQYWEPAKWVAKLRKYNTSKNPIYLHTNMKAGHGGASGRFEPYKETALVYAFMIDLLK